MTEMFYAIYSPSKDQWLDADLNYGPFAKAEKFFHRNDILVDLEGDQRIVGPCNEGDYK